MLKIVDSLLKRKYKYYNPYLFICISFIVAIVTVIFQRIVNTPFVTIFVLLSCFLNSNKETVAFLQLSKFDAFRLTSERTFKLSLFLYVKRNKFIWFSLFFSVLCLTNFSMIMENVSLILIAIIILFCNFIGNKLGETIAEIHFVILIVLVTFNLGYYFPVAANGMFCSGLIILLMDDGTREKKDQRSLKKIVLSNKVPALVRYFIFGKWKSNLCLLIVFLLPKIVVLLGIKIHYSFMTTMNFMGMFLILLIFELLQDVNLEKRGIEYNRLRMYKLFEINFFKRVLLSNYIPTSLIALFLVLIINIFDLRILITQALLIIMLVLWYKFFEEKSLIEKNKPTWQLSYIRCWIPSTTVFLFAFAPQIAQYIEKIRG